MKRSVKLSDKIMRMIEDMQPVTSPVTERSHLYNELGYDSLAFISLLLEIEKAFSVKFELTEMDSCLNVNRLIALVEAKTKESAYD